MIFGSLSTFSTFSTSSTSSTYAMTLAPGSRVGVYEIREAIGAGGPAYARGVIRRELRRGLALAKEART
jgi:hypothetical protein